MRLSVERLRWGLLAGVLLLMTVVLVLLGYGRYRAVQMWRRIVARSGATITHETNGFTYSQAVGGRTVFTLHAAKAVPQGDGRYTLHDAVLILYGQNGSRTDRIYGSDFDYDQKTGVAKALGEVHMDLQPPSALSAKKGEKSAGAGTQTAETEWAEGGVESPQTIHVRTSGLVYVRKLGVAATDQDVEIAYQGFVGHARGAEFDSGQDVVHLLNDVRVDGSLRGAPISLRASKADLDQRGDVMTLMQPNVRSRDRTASAATAVLHLRQDGSVEHVHATGNVVLQTGAKRVQAPRLEAEMSVQSLCEVAEFPDGVEIDDSVDARTMHGTARTMRVDCDRAGEPSNVVADGGVTGAEAVPVQGGQALHRQMAANRVVVTMKRAAGGRSTELSEIEATGSAWVRSESLTKVSAAVKRSQVKTTQVAGDDLKLLLAMDAEGKDEPQILTGAGHTRLEQRTPDGAEETSTGDALQVRFAEGAAAAKGAGEASGVSIASAEQTGHVSIESEPAMGGSKEDAQATTGTAQRAVYDGSANELTLYGDPQLERGDTSVTAETIALAEDSGDAVAQGKVSAWFVGAKAAPGAPATHAMSATAVLNRAAETIEFRGTDAQPARMWQGASQLEAASIVLDRAHDTLMARPAAANGLVHAVFASTASATGEPRPGRSATRRTGSTGGAAQVVRIASGRLDYSGGTRQAVFAGGVRAEGATGDVRAERGVVFLQAASAVKGPAAKSESGAAKSKEEPDPMAGSVDRIVLSGDVRLEEPGRHGTGQQLLYTAATGEFVLTGAPGRPPHVVDESQGSITGATLIFGSANSTIVVAGETGAHGQARGRVHTETQMKP